MIFQMITENQSKAVNDIKSQSQLSFFHEHHGTAAGILLQNDYDGVVTVRQGKKLPTKSDQPYFRGWYWEGAEDVQRT